MSKKVSPARLGVETSRAWGMPAWGLGSRLGRVGRLNFKNRVSNSLHYSHWLRARGCIVSAHQKYPDARLKTLPIARAQARRSAERSSLHRAFLPQLGLQCDFDNNQLS